MGMSATAGRARAVDLQDNPSVLKPVSAGRFGELLTKVSVADLHSFPTV